MLNILCSPRRANSFTLRIAISVKNKDHRAAPPLLSHPLAFLTRLTEGKTSMCQAKQADAFFPPVAWPIVRPKTP